MSYNASAPATVMLLGEYGVLYNHPALLCALDQRIRVSVSKRKDNLIAINSTLGETSIPIDEATTSAPFDYTFACVKACGIKTGLNIHIDSRQFV